MKPLCPRHKRLKREGRLQAAKHWLPKYEGKSIVKGYSKHFGVNKICAALELILANVMILMNSRFRHNRTNKPNFRKVFKL